MWGRGEWGLCSLRRDSLCCPCSWGRGLQCVLSQQIHGGDQGIAWRGGRGCPGRWESWGSTAACFQKAPLALSINAAETRLCLCLPVQSQIACVSVLV